MHFIVWLVAGGLLGWFASAMLGGWLLTPLAGTGALQSNNFSIAGLAESQVGAIVLPGIVNLVRRKSLPRSPADAVPAATPPRLI